jgi:hypothetical protein
MERGTNYIWLKFGNVFQAKSYRALLLIYIDLAASLICPFLMLLILVARYYARTGLCKGLFLNEPCLLVQVMCNSTWVFVSVSALLDVPDGGRDASNFATVQLAACHAPSASSTSSIIFSINSYSLSNFSLLFNVVSSIGP